MSTIKVNKIENTASSSGGIDIDSSGKVGVGGVSSPSAPFHLNAGTTNNALFVDSSDAEVSIGLAASGGAVRLLQSSGALIIRANGNANAFGTGDSERARFLAAGGLTFNGDTAAANALDDYEEGTWTPAISGTSTDNSGGYSTYTKIGNRVFFQTHLILNGNPGDTFSISGLPFSSSSASRSATTIVIQDASNSYAQVGGQTATVSDSVSSIGCDMHGTITLASGDRVNLFGTYIV